MWLQEITVILYGAFAVLKWILLVLGLHKVWWELVFEVRMRKIYMAMDCGSSESNWGFCMLE